MDKVKTVQDLADKIKTIIEDPELISRLAEQDAKDGTVSKILDQLDKKTSDLEKLYTDNR
jgi:hypothetical protein